MLKTGYNYSILVTHMHMHTRTDTHTPIHTNTQLMDNLELYVGGITFEMQRYKDTYACEVKMNEEFHRFVSNYRRAYEGPNTASHQLQRELTFHTCKAFGISLS